MSAARLIAVYDGSAETEIAISDDSGVSYPTVRATPTVTESIPVTGDDKFWCATAAAAFHISAGILAMMDDYGLIIYSLDEGQNWTVVNTFNDSDVGDGFFPLGMIATVAGFFAWGDWYAASNWVVGYSTDYGASWIRTASILTDTLTVAECNLNNGTILLGSVVNDGTASAAELARSTNGGATFAAVTGHGVAGSIVTFCSGQSGEWWAVGHDNTGYVLYHSTDDGLTFSAVTLPAGLNVVPSHNEPSLSYDETSATLYVSGSTGSYPTGHPAVAWSTDGGATWSSVQDLNPPLDYWKAGEIRYVGDSHLVIREGGLQVGYMRALGPSPSSFDGGASSFPGSDGGMRDWLIVEFGTLTGGGSFPVQPSVPSARLPRVFEILSGPTASGTCLASFDGLSAGRLEFRVDNQDHGELTVDEEASWLSAIDTDLILRITDHNDRISEWRIEEIRESEEGDGLAHIQLRPLYQDLGRVVVRQEIVGGETEIAITAPEMTPGEVYDSILAPQMPTWVSKGTFAPTQKVSTTQTGWSIQQWVDWLASETKHEVWFERVAAADYNVHIIPQRGSTAKTLTALPTKQVLSLERTRRLANIATHLIPIGMTVPGATQPAGIGQNAWVVVDVDSSSNYIDIEDPNGADDPVYFDDEFNATTTAGIARSPYVVATDGSLEEILDSALVGGVSRLYLASVTSFTVGDMVSIVKNSSGTHLPGLYDPSAVAAYGVIEGTVDLTSLRGERNYAPNSEPRNWTIDGQAWAGQSNGGSSGTSLPLTNMHVGDSIPSGAYVYHASPGTSPVTTTTTEVVDGAGQVTLSLSGSMTVSAGAYCYVYVPNSAPDQWTANGAYPLLWRTSRSQTAILSDADGDQTSVLYLDVKNLSAGEWIPFGWEVNGIRIIEEATADGSGNVTLKLAELITVSDDDALTIVGILMGENAGDVDRVVALTAGTNTAPHSYESEAIAVLPQGYPVYAQAWLTSERGDWEYGAAVSNWSPPRMRLIPSVDPVVEVYDQDRASYPTPFDFRLRCASPAPTSTQTYQVRIYPPEYHLSPLYQTVVTEFYCRGIMLHTGPDPDAPFVYGAHADPMWHSVHRALGLHGAPETSYVITMRDLSALVSEGYVAADNLIVVGGTLRIVSQRFSLDTTRRILVYIVDLAVPENCGIVLDEYEPELTRLLVEIRQLQAA